MYNLIFIFLFFFILGIDENKGTKRLVSNNLLLNNTQSKVNKKKEQDKNLLCSFNIYLKNDKIY